MNPRQRAGNVDGVLVGVARAGDRVADRGVAAHLYERRPNGRIERGSVLKPEARRSGVIDGFVEEKLVPQKRKARDAGQRRRKCVCLLRHEVLRALSFSDRKARHVGARRRERIDRVSLRKHIAEIQTSREVK